MKFCEIRVISSVFFLIIVSIVLFYVAFNFEKWVGDTSTYKEVQATFKSGEIFEDTSNNPPVFYVDVSYSYTVDNVSYPAIQKIGPFKTRIAANQNLLSQMNNSRKLYYDPKTPSKNTEQINSENAVVIIIFVIALFILSSALTAFFLRKNQFFCGYQLASDAINITSGFVQQYN